MRSPDKSSSVERGAVVATNPGDRPVLVYGPLEKNQARLEAAGGARYTWVPLRDVDELASRPFDDEAVLVIAGLETPASREIETLARWAARGGIAVIGWTPNDSEGSPVLDRFAREVVRHGGAQDVVRTFDRILNRSASSAAREGTVVLSEGQLRSALLGFPKGLIILDERERVLLVNGHATRLLRLTAPPHEGDFLPVTLRELQEGLCHDDGQRVTVRARPFTWNRRPARWLELTAVHSDGDEATRRARRLHVDRLAAVGQMAAGVAHEVNNPVAYISANTNTISDRVDRLETVFRKLRNVVAEVPEVARSFDSVMDKLDVQESLRELREITKENLEGAGRISAIVRDLKNFSRIEPDQVEVVSVNQIVNEACMLVAHQIRFKAELVKKLGEVPRLPIARQKLCQVVTNLLMNAAQAIPEGDQKGHRIQVKTWAESDRIIISVADTGCGIPDRLKKRIFEPFVTTKEKDGGTGLGLSLCADIVRQHGGDIRLYSKLGQGSQFEVVLPLQTGLTPKEATQDTRPVEPRAKTRARILLVDDEMMLLRAFQRLLGPHHDVTTASGGSEAIKVLQADQGFDVVICDLMMPDVDGPMLHAEIQRRWPALEHRMIFCSGGAFSPRVRTFADQVRERCIEKPVTLQQLTVAIERIRSATSSDMPVTSPSVDQHARP